MKNKILAIVVILAVMVSWGGVAAPVKAAAYGVSFTTSITYQNVGSATANILIDFYNSETSTAIPITMTPLPANAASSVFVGSLSSITAGFKGSAVMSSDQPLVATLVQVPPNSSPVKTRPLSNSFMSGASTVVVPTVVKNTFGYTSVVSIQNVDTVGADLTVEFVPVGGSSFSVNVTNLPAGSAKYYDMGTFSNPNIGSAFNGSMRIVAKKTGTATPGAVVASSLEMGVTKNVAYAFEGINLAANKVFMPSALCNYYGGMNSFYAVQNVGTSAIDITVTYSNGQTETATNVLGGAKYSFNGCGASGTLNPALFIGSATITASASGQIAAVAKIQGNSVATAFPGFISGARFTALPYVRWTDSQWNSGARQRTYLAIQNIGSTDLAAGDVKVYYFDKNGASLGVHSLGAITVGAKVNSNAKDASASNTEFGYYLDGTFGGSAVVAGPAGSELAVIARVQSISTGEDYSGFPISSFTPPAP